MPDDTLTRTPRIPPLVPWPLPPRSLHALRRRLLAWFDAERRPLPWRDTDDPYKVWVSEIMLQQTRVDTVWPYYERWLEAFPTVYDLAHADPDDVLRFWSGLGYYSRARNLHKAAQTLVHDHDGKVPDRVEDLLRLPGVGPYSAGAIASIAHRVPAPAVDGNALRVLARLTGNREPIDATRTRKRLTEHATRLVDPDRPGEWNQAIMELGATHCTPRNPTCTVCPVQHWCTAHHDGTTSKIPRTRAKKQAVTQNVHFALIRDDDHVLLVGREPTGLLGGTWGLPGGLVDRPLGTLVREQTGLRARKGRLLGETEHRFTHRHWIMQVYTCRIKNGSRARGTNGNTHWVPLDGIDHAPLATATRKALVIGL